MNIYFILLTFLSIHLIFFSLWKYIYVYISPNNEKKKEKIISHSVNVSTINHIDSLTDLTLGSIDLPKKTIIDDDKKNEKFYIKRRVLNFTGIDANISNCPPLSPSSTVPNDIMNLKPGDIRLIMAMGDSITAGFFAKISSPSYYNPKDFLEFRGINYATGGDKEAITLPNFFSRYRRSDDNLIGLSQGSRYGIYCLGSWCPPKSWFYDNTLDGLNAAIIGGTSADLVRQIDYLLNWMNKSAIDMSIVKNEWKLLSLFIGSNDICSDSDSLCNSVIPAKGQIGDPEVFKVNVHRALRQLRHRLPRTIVNLIQLTNITEMHEYYLSDPRCAGTEFLRQLHCPCLSTPQGRSILSQRTFLFNEVLANISQSYVVKREKPMPFLEKLVLYQPDFERRTKYDDFAVILTVAFRESKPSNLPVEFLSEMDCFHPSVYAHQYYTVAIWNSLFLNSSNKPLNLSYPLDLYCPKETDRIQVI